MESWSSGMGVGHETDNLIPCKDDCSESSKKKYYTDHLAITWVL
jgi:hypothetical protein